MRSSSGKNRPGSVRIIGGEWRRRRILLPEGSSVRPTPDRIRETLFNWLTPAIPGALCLDLFAGSGVLGFEALSRGASHAALVERDRRAVEALERQRNELGAAADIFHADAGEFARRSGIGPFGIIFVDPPYALPVQELLQQLAPLLKPRGMLYLERQRDDEWPEVPGLQWSRRAVAGAIEYGVATRAD